MIKAVIIEDEKNSSELLKQFIVAYGSGIQVLGVADRVSSAIQLIKETNPAIVFLDVEILEGSGFDVLDAFEQPAFRVVFVTGYDHYALKAIKYSALDYLLKPVSVKEFKEVIEKVRTSYLGPAIHNVQINYLKENRVKRAEEIGQIVIKDDQRYTVISFHDIIWVEAQRSYAIFHLVDDRKYVSAHPLSYFEDLLPTIHFFRIHKSYIVNFSKVLKVDTGRGGMVHLTDSTQLPIAYRRKTTFIEALNKANN